MILVFDLDDTLYDESSFVMSGFRAVARFGKATFGWDVDHSVAFMHDQLLQYGRGKIFDEWLRYNGRCSNTLISACVRMYRNHAPEIELFTAAEQVLKKYKDCFSLYIVTDGHKVAQRNKVNVLRLNSMFKRILITHCFGIRYAKPSLHCFDVVRRAERCDWSEMIYVGDNPAKDFVNLNPMGVLTVRVRTGVHAGVVARPGYDARITIPDLTAFSMIIDKLS